jgi:hypothetical protein
VSVSRAELKDRLLMELGFVLDVPRRALFDVGDPNPSTTKLALTQGQYSRELNEWVNSRFRPFITIHGSEIPHFWNSVMESCYAVRDLLVSQDDLPRKKQRFETAVSATLAAIRAIPADDPDVIVPPKSAFIAYRRLHAVCATAATRVHLFDPYLDAQTFLLYFPDVPDGVELKVVSDQTIMLPNPTDKKRTFQRDRIIATSEILASERPSNYYFLMVPSIHDRHLRADDRIFHLGGSVAHASLKDYYSITETDSNPVLHATLDGIIASATPWYKPGMLRHRRWCLTCGLVNDVKPSGACQVCNTLL